MPYPKLDGLLDDLAAFIAHADEKTAALGPGRDKDLLSASLTRLKELHATATVELRAGVDWMYAVTEHQLARVAALKADLATVRAEIAAAAAKAAQDAGAAQAAKAAKAAAQAAASAPAPLDPGLGAKLRDELLSRFGRPGDGPAAPPRTGQDIWENWN
jgi:hypothetical protein